jgi:hypothetical protein
LSFFDFIQKVCFFFSSSTRRWNILSNCISSDVSVRLKRISDTRWSARADAVLALKRGYKNINEALVQISLNKREKPISKLEVRKLIKTFDDFETA